MRSEFGVDGVNSKAAKLVFSCLRDKPVAELAQILFPLFDEVIFAPIHSARAISTSDLLAAAKAVGTSARVCDSVSDALSVAGQSSSTVVVSGSVYLVGEARPLLLTRANVPTSVTPGTPQ